MRDLLMTGRHKLLTMPSQYDSAMWYTFGMERTDKKKLISETYLKLLACKPVDKITVTMLIEECGLSRQTFYYHFKDILDVIEYILTKNLEEIIGVCRAKNDPVEGLRDYIEMIDKNRILIRRLSDTSRWKEVHRCVVDTITGITESIIEKQAPYGTDYNVSELRFALSVYAHGFEGYILDKIDKNEPIDPDQLAGSLYKLFTGELNLTRF